MSRTWNVIGRSGRRLPVFHQTEMTECGLICLAMVGSYHGHDLNPAGLRSRYPAPARGSTLRDLISLAAKLGLTSRPLRLDMDHIRELKTPCVLHWDMNHFVVLKSAGRRSLVIHDPASGRKRLSYEEFSRHFTGIALELSPDQGFTRESIRESVSFADFYRNMRGLNGGLLQLLLLSLFLLLLTMALPFYMQIVLDDVVISRDESLLAMLAIAFLLITLFRSATKALRDWIVLYLGSTFSFQMGVNIFNHLIHLPLDFFEKRHAGDLVSRFGSLTAIRSFMTEGMIGAIVDGLMSVAMLIMMFVYSPLLGGVVTGAFILYFGFRMAVHRPFREITGKSIGARAGENTNYLESIRGIQSIRLYNGEQERLGIWQNHYAGVMQADISLGRFRITFQAVHGILSGIENVAVIWLGAGLVLSGEISAGMLVAFVSYKQTFAENMSALVEKLVEFRMLSLHLDRLADLVLPEREDPGRENSGIRIRGGIRLSGLTFAYDTAAPPLLRDINTRIRAGECVAITGPSGSGKTTLLKVMLGLLEPTAGAVLVDDINVTEVRRAFRSRVATVMQDDQLLSGSILENIAFFDSCPDHERIAACARTAGIHDEIEAMPMGYQSLIGDMGSSLSGGQKQRILLARALYRQPAILFLDEATSHLDTAMESSINTAIAELKITRIIIAHRPATIRSADRILELRDGSLREVRPEAFDGMAGQGTTEARLLHGLQAGGLPHGST